MVATAETPAICLRIRTTRERLKDEWAADHPGEKGNPFTQENVRARVGPFGVSSKAFSLWETEREPSMARLREIAGALYLDEDYFLPTSDLVTATARVEAEAARLGQIGDQLQSFLEVLRSRLADEESEGTPDGQ